MFHRTGAGRVRLSDLIASAQWRYRGLPPALVDRAVRRIFEEIIETLGEGGRVELRGFGVLEVREREGGQRRNPRTGEAIEVEGKRHVHWRTGKTLAKSLQVSSET